MFCKDQAIESIYIIKNNLSVLRIFIPFFFTDLFTFVYGLLVFKTGQLTNIKEVDNDLPKAD